MKSFERKIKYVLLAFFVLLAQWMPAFCQDDVAKQSDSIEISLLTCMPRPYVYSLYGHTAIRYTDKTSGLDVVINYGMFSFDKPYFLLRFVFGLTDYEMGIEYFDDFKAQYEKSGCGVKQQVLNLTPNEKQAISVAINENYQPKNRVYRYNYLYDNCTTRARDILLHNIEGDIIYKNTQSVYPSYRELIHKYNIKHRWARFGNDLLLGLPADYNTTLEQQQFLPENLSYDFANAKIVDSNGLERPLVVQTSWIMSIERDSGTDGFPLSPRMCMTIISLLIVVLTLYELHTRSNLWVVDLILLLLTGLCGLVLFAMLFSQHPTVSLNLQILLLNPFCLVFAHSVVKSFRRGTIAWWTKAWTLCILLFVFGGIMQSYAEGMYFLALSLLFRNIIKISQQAKKYKR